MGLKFNREDVSLGAIPIGQYPTDTSTTPAPTGLPHRAVDWGVLPSGLATQVLTVNADGSIGWSNPASPISSPGSGTASEQFGASASTGSANDAVALGNTATATTGSVAVGYKAAPGVSSTYAVIIGYQASSTGTSACVIGSGAKDTSTSGSTIAIGAGANAGGNNSLALGSSTTVGSSHYWSIALGGSATTTAASQLMVGNSTAYITSTVICGGTGGTAINLAGNSSTTTTRDCGIIASSFNSSTDSSWTGNLSLYAGDYTSSNAGQRLGLQIQSNGSAALVGLFGATPVVRPVGGGGNTSMTANTGTAVLAGSTFTGVSGSSTYTIGDIVTALKSLGILTA